MRHRLPLSLSMSLGQLAQGCNRNACQCTEEDLCLKLGLYKAIQVYKWLDLNH